MANDVSTTYTQLGYVNITSANTAFTITLSDSISDYKEILICKSYYSNGLPIYAHIYLPVSFFERYTSEYVLGAGVDKLSSSMSLVGIGAKYTSDTSITVIASIGASSNNFIVVYGIK